MMHSDEVVRATSEALAVSLSLRGHRVLKVGERGGKILKQLEFKLCSTTIVCEPPGGLKAQGLYLVSEAICMCVRFIFKFSDKNVCTFFFFLHIHKLICIYRYRIFRMINR